MTIICTKDANINVPLFQSVVSFPSTDNVRFIKHSFWPISEGDATTDRAYSYTASGSLPFGSVTSLNLASIIPGVVGRTTISPSSLNLQNNSAGPAFYADTAAAYVDLNGASDEFKAWTQFCPLGITQTIGAPALSSGWHVTDLGPPVVSLLSDFQPHVIGGNLFFGCIGTCQGQTDVRFFGFAPGLGLFFDNSNSGDQSGIPIATTIPSPLNCPDFSSGINHYYSDYDGLTAPLQTAITHIQWGIGGGNGQDLITFSDATDNHLLNQQNFGQQNRTFNSVTGGWLCQILGHGPNAGQNNKFLLIKKDGTSYNEIVFIPQTPAAVSAIANARIEAVTIDPSGILWFNDSIRNNNMLTSFGFSLSPITFDFTRVNPGIILPCQNLCHPDYESVYGGWTQW